MVVLRFLQQSSRVRCHTTIMAGRWVGRYVGSRQVGGYIGRWVRR